VNDKTIPQGVFHELAFVWILRYNPHEGIIAKFTIMIRKSCTMEFKDKLQKLRKEKGLTQEELSAQLYVSRTAISKWESGRGFPAIDSLKAISRFFDVSIDDLLSENQIALSVEDSVNEESHFFAAVFPSILDLLTVALCFLPAFVDRTGGHAKSASLISLHLSNANLKIIFFIAVIATAACGIISLMLKNKSSTTLSGSIRKGSLALSALCSLLFIASMQPYAAAIMFVFTLIKLFALLKKR